MRRMALVLLLTALPSLACALSESPTAVPTPLPAPVLQNPVVGLTPISGAPGTLVNVVVAGFPAGSRVNIYLSTLDTTNANPAAQDLNIGAGGILIFSMQVPDKIGDKTLTGTTPISFTVATTDNALRASAVFLATSGTPQPTEQTAAGGGATGGGQLFITSPAINSTIAGSAVVVTGSGAAANNRVGVQVLDSTYHALGSGFATIQAGSGAVGPWQTTVSFTQPAAASVGYIVAYTVNAQGGIAQQASIPVLLAGGVVPTTAPTAIRTPPTLPPTVPPVITVGPTAGGGGFITATP
jgi:Immunoglobulin-like domain of bacterial spore germination